MTAKRVLLICLEAVVILGVFGCAPSIVSTDAGVWQTGKLYAVSSRDIDAVYQAAQQAMDKLQFKVTDKAKDVFFAKVIAKSADGKLIVVNMKPTEDKKTAYNIQVGALGDEERSRKIFSEMEIALGPAKSK